MDSQFGGSDGGAFNAHGAKQLEQALRHVSEGWLPVSNEALRAARAQFKKSQASGSRVEFISELKKDFALFAFCVRELAKKAVVRGQAGQFDPKTLFDNATDDDLRDIILHDSRGISIHSLEEISAPQAKLIRQAMTSAAAAETLGQVSTVDPLNAFSLALLRQLGLSLIAWNYPNVFKRCLSATSQVGSLDEALSDVLGFTPTMLGARMGMEWGFSPLISAGMGDPKSREEISSSGGELAQKLLVLDKICRVSESFGAASASPMTNRAPNYVAARNEIELILGPDLFKSLQEKIAHSCAIYAQYAPQFFPHLDESMPHKGKPAAGSIEANVYIKHCEPHTRAELKALYLNMKGTAARENVEILIKDIIPEAGFASGAIYLVEPETSRLVPRLAFGNRAVSTYQPVNFASTSSTYDPAASAFRCSSPIMEENVDLGWGTISYIVGALGENPKMGVMLLELDQSLDISNPILVFKALKTALCDCLGI